MVQLVEMIIDKYSPSLYASLGIFLPLIAVNCSILGTSLFMGTKGYGLVESTVFGASVFNQDISGWDVSGVPVANQVDFDTGTDVNWTTKPNFSSP